MLRVGGHFDETFLVPGPENNTRHTCTPQVQGGKGRLSHALILHWTTYLISGPQIVDDHEGRPQAIWLGTTQGNNFLHFRANNTFFLCVRWASEILVFVSADELPILLFVLKEPILVFVSADKYPILVFVL